MFDEEKSEKYITNRISDEVGYVISDVVTEALKTKFKN